MSCTEIKNKVLVLIIFNLTNSLLKNKIYREVIQLCDEGIASLKTMNSTRLIGELLYNKGEALINIDPKNNVELALLIISF